MSAGLSLIGLSIGLAALMSSGGLAIFAGVIAFAFLVGSMAVSILPDPSPGEPWRPVGGEVIADAKDEPVNRPGQEAGHHWRHTVAASRHGSRHR